MNSVKNYRHGSQLIALEGFARPRTQIRREPIPVAWAFRLLISRSFESANFPEQDSKRMLQFFRSIRKNNISD